MKLITNLLRNLRTLFRSWSIIGDHTSLQTPTAILSKTPSLSPESFILNPKSHFRDPKSHFRDPKSHFRDPRVTLETQRVTLETPRSSLETPRFPRRPSDLFRRPHKFSQDTSQWGTRGGGVRNIRESESKPTLGRACGAPTFLICCWLLESIYISRFFRINCNVV